MTQSKISLTATLVVHDLERYALTQIVKAFSQASGILRSVSAKHRVTHQVALHALAYKRLSSLKEEERDPSLSEPLPSQYAHRAIQRLSHQARAQRHSLEDPYPSNSFDLDSRCADLRPLEQAIAITTINARGTHNGFTRDGRIIVPLRFASKADRNAAFNGRLLGATVSMPPKGSPKIVLSIQPEDNNARDTEAPQA